MNDQFSSAYDRPNLVTVEVEVPESELTSGYRAEGAKDAVGEMDWHSGPVSTKLAKAGKPRKVILSRYCKVTRVVPDAEVAQKVKELIGDTDAPIPQGVVTPSLYAELEKAGVKVAPSAQFRRAAANNADAKSGNAFRPSWRISRLYTGSAADYEKPSLLKIGTGEGSQVYGWGLYASDRRGVAEGYAKIANENNRSFSARCIKIEQRRC